MFMPYVPETNNLVTRIVTLGDGENVFSTPFAISESESRYSRNLTGDNYPALQTRAGRAETFTSITTPNALGVRDNQYPHVLDGTTWKRWSGTEWVNVQTSLANSQATIIEFARGTDLYNILADGTNVYSWDGTTSTELSEAPVTNLYTAHRGRIYGLKDKVLYFSALNLITDWTTANDAGQISITRAKGDGTAITTFDDHVCVFTDYSFHELYGTGPHNYQLVDVSENGCISNRTLVEVKGNTGGLFWLDYDGFYRYAGGKPQRISDKVKTYIDDINLTYKTKCCAGKSGRKIYLSIPYGTATENNLLLMYDTELEKWYPQTGDIVDFVNIGELLYGIDSSGQIWNMESGTLNGDWSFVSGAREKQITRDKKTLTEIWVNFYLPQGSKMRFSTSTSVDKDDFVEQKSFYPSDDKQIKRVLINMDESNSYRIKFDGENECTIYSIEEIFRVKE